MNTSFSIIVTNYNGKKVLSKCINSILAQSYKAYEIIIADDGSTDDSIDYVKKKYKNKIKYSILKQNRGLSVNCNKAVKISSKNYLIFLNNDSILEKNFLKKCNKNIYNTNCDVIIPKVFTKNKTDKDLNDIGYGIDIYGYPCAAWRAGSAFYSDGIIIINKKKFLKIGEFDEDFFLYGEDIDLFWRIQIAKLKICVDKNLILNHFGSGSSFKITKEINFFYKRRKLVERQTLHTLLKYYNFYLLLGILPRLFIFYFLEFSYLLISKFSLKSALIYPKSIIWNFAKINEILKKRREIKKIRKLNNKELLKKLYPKYRKLEIFLNYSSPKKIIFNKFK